MPVHVYRYLSDSRLLRTHLCSSSPVELSRVDAPGQKNNEDPQALYDKATAAEQAMERHMLAANRNAVRRPTHRNTCLCLCVRESVSLFVWCSVSGCMSVSLRLCLCRVLCVFRVSVVCQSVHACVGP